MPLTDIQFTCLRRKLSEVMETCYPGLLQIPPREGGLVFREMANSTGAKESDIADLAKCLGFWNYTQVQIAAQCTCEPEVKSPVALALLEVLEAADG